VISCKFYKTGAVWDHPLRGPSYNHQDGSVVRLEAGWLGGIAEGATAFASLLQSDEPLPDVRIAPREDPAVLPYSSGTAGRPKGVMLTHYNLVAITRQVEPLARYRESDRTLGVLPFYHNYGMVMLMNYPLYKGRMCVTMPRLDLEQFLGIMQHCGLTHLDLVRPIVLALAKHPLVDQCSLSSVKLIASGAASLDEGIQQVCAQLLGCPVLQGYGMAETSLAMHLTPDESEKIMPGSDR
jgi:acyl-CoA synthetase (AMP-forming)/AMP-acid ligase II